MPTNTIIIGKKLTNKQMEEAEGTYFPEAAYDHIIDEDTDVYREDGSVLLKFRKNVIPKAHTTAAVKSFAKYAKKLHTNRGPSAGILNRDKLPNYVGTLVNAQKYRTHYHSRKTGKLAKQNESNSAPSNVAGYWDKADRNIGATTDPCRETDVTRDKGEKWKNAKPFINSCDQLYKTLQPFKWKEQRDACSQIPEWTIDETAFSTITVNYSWRTALHKDAGDFRGGMGNLTVIDDPDNKNEYTGAYTGFPQYGVAVNVREGDFLVMDVHDWHCNTEFKSVHDNVLGKWSEKKIKNNWYFNRVSFVMYLREKMVRCKKD